jgi:hypothetical protein
LGGTASVDTGHSFRDGRHHEKNMTSSVAVHRPRLSREAVTGRVGPLVTSHKNDNHSNSIIKRVVVVVLVVVVDAVAAVAAAAVVVVVVSVAFVVSST